MTDRFKAILVMGLLISIGAIERVSSAEDVVARGRHQLPDYEADVYGPLPFSEEVTGFLVHELNYILKRQNKNGSWDSAQPIGNGRSKTEAGGTVGNVTLTAMCAYSLRNYVEFGPETYEDAIQRALRFVTYMINSGKLRNNVIDAPWHYIYSLRFLVSEYPNVKDPLLKKQVEDACAVIVRELKDTQHGTYGQRSIRVRWEKRSSPGMTVKDTEDSPGMVVQCDTNSPAFAVGIRDGDRLLAANGVLVDTAVRYAMSELDWVSGDTVEFMVLRGEKILKFQVKLPGQYPGTLGLRVRENEEGVSIGGFDFLSNRDSVPLRLGDRILKVDDHAITTKADLDRLSLYAGQEVKLRVLRDGNAHHFDYVCAPVPAADFGVSFPGRRFDQSTQDGLPIDRFMVGSCLKAAGLHRGDRLLRIDGALVLNRRHFNKLTHSLWGGKKVTVTYLSAEQEKDAEVTAGSLPNEKWLKGYHGLKLGKGGVVDSVNYGSPADKAGCKAKDRILEINGTPAGSDRQANSLLSGVASGKLLTMAVLRDGERKQIRFVTNRPADSVWIAGRKDAGGGWGYLTGVRGSNTFVTADALRELLKAKQAMPKLDVPDQMLYRAFLVLSKLRMKQPNSDVESYRYDAAGSFWRVKDIRGDVGRLNSAELACLMYCDTDMQDSGHVRTQKHLEKTLQEWLKHRGILDLVKFPRDHADYSIAPWFWMYSYRTTLEAADYLTINDELKEEVRRTALKAFFKHMEFRYEPKLEAVGWIIGGDLDKELHDSCQLLDGLATMKHLYRPRLEVAQPALQEAMKPFYETRYGEAYKLIREMIAAGKTKDREVAAEVERVLAAIKDRFDTRLAEVKNIHRQNPFDGVYHLESMKRHFQGYPGMSEAEKLAKQWRQRLPELPPKEERELVKLGPFPGNLPAGESEQEAWSSILAMKKAPPSPGKWEGAVDLLETVDTTKDSISGRWKKVGGQIVSSEKPYARIQLPGAPPGSYRFEAQFTRIRGDCMAVMFPVGNTSALLVVGGWKGRASGLAFIRGKDADRNETTRDGKLSNGEKHTLLLEVRMPDNKQARIAVWLDGKAYLDWEGERSALTPDRYWGLRRAGSVGVGAYNATIVFHNCQLQMLEAGGEGDGSGDPSYNSCFSADPKIGKPGSLCRSFRLFRLY